MNIKSIPRLVWLVPVVLLGVATARLPLWLLHFHARIGLCITTVLIATRRRTRLSPYSVATGARLLATKNCRSCFPWASQLRFPGSSSAP